MPDLGCFKAYDIRGRVPDHLNEELAKLIGRAFVEIFNPGAVVVGQDARLESPGLAGALIEGLTGAGADVIDIGLCGSEEVYFHTFHREREGAGGGVMVTASHNPKGYNGLKLVGPGARPISADTGLLDIRGRVQDLLETNAVIERARRPGTVTNAPDKSAYAAHLTGYLDPDRLKPLKIVLNPGNGGAGPAIRALARDLPFELTVIQETPDGTFPNGVPNPLLPDRRRATADAVRERQADFGAAFDGDFDRCFFFDEAGCFIEGYYLVGLFAAMFLKRDPGAAIVHDPRLTWNTLDIVGQMGGRAFQSRTGHALIKQTMRDKDAVYGGEMSAHHYFRDFAYCDSGMIPWLLVAQLISETGRPLSDLVSERMRRFPCSGEINYRVSSAPGVLARIDEKLGSQALERDETDGLSLVFQDWRLNVRPSNTEPLLRLNLETRGDPELLRDRLAMIDRLINTEK